MLVLHLEDCMAEMSGLHFCLVLVVPVLLAVTVYSVHKLTKMVNTLTTANSFSLWRWGGLLFMASLSFAVAVVAMAKLADH